MYMLLCACVACVYGEIGISFKYHLKCCFVVNLRCYMAKQSREDAFEVFEDVCGMLMSRTRQ